MRRTPTPDPVNTDGWMMSYADMVTILLAMLIVLSALSSDQTGLTLSSGAASFNRALGTFGLPGFSPSGPRPLTTNYSTPDYLFVSRTEATGEAAEEPLERLLAELHRQFPVERLRAQAGEVVIDLYEPLHREAPILAAHHCEVLARLRPLLERPSYRLHLVVWTPTPQPSAWNRAAARARLAADEFLADSHLSPDAAGRLVPLAQPWRYRDIRRPVLSLVLVRAGE